MPTEIHTNELCRFVGTLINKMLKGLFKTIRKLVVPLEAMTHYVVHLVLKIQQLLNHCLILLWVNNNCATLLLLKEIKITVVSKLNIYDATNTTC